MDQAVSTLQTAGASEQLLSDFRALLEATTLDGAPRFAPRPVLNWLARFVVGREGGPNRDAPLYELCHLVNAIDACGSDPDRQAQFFLESRRAAPSAFRQHIDQLLEMEGWRRDGFSRDEDGFDIQYRDGSFKVTFGRMTFLVALYEFLCGMEAYGFYPDFIEILETMTSASDSIKSIQTASNAISRHVRQYRKHHLNFSNQNGRFEQIYGFLQERSPGERIRIDDASVLEFWLRSASDSDFKLYKTVFKLFVEFRRVAEETARHQSAEGALRIGIDHEAGETDPEDSDQYAESLGDWRTPFAVLDAEPASRIKFFKKTNEREHIEALMEYGPGALALPLAFLRVESFGGTQDAIRADLQFNRMEATRGRLTCSDCESYMTKLSSYETILSHVRLLQKATLHALHSKVDKAGVGNVIAFQPKQPETAFEAALERNDLPEIDEENMDRIAHEAANAFRRLTRKGFNDAALEDTSTQEGFRTGAGAILSISAQLEAFIEKMMRLDQMPKNLEDQHVADRAVFSAQFAKIYGDTV